MPLTREFKETIVKRVRKDTKFRRALLSEAVETLLNGDIETGKAILRDYINATIGFEELAVRMNKDSKSIHRMLGPAGNPRAENIFTIISILQQEDNISLSIRADKRSAA